MTAYGLSAIRLSLLLVVAGLYAPVVAEMIRVWRAHAYAGHGMFVPAFSAMCLWVDRARLRAAPRGGHVAGLPVMLLGLGLLALGRDVGGLIVQGLSIVVTLAGAVLWSYGARVLRVAAFPIAFLALMVPLPRTMVDAVTLDLQLFAAGFAAAALRLVGIPVYRNGLEVEVSTVALQVAEVCNGLRFLAALLVLTLAFAHITQRGAVRKLLLVASAVPIAILANAVRVAAIAAGAHYFGPAVASGTVHHLIGKSVWALTLLPLIALALLLRRGGAGAARGRAGAHPASPREAPTVSSVLLRVEDPRETARSG